MTHKYSIMLAEDEVEKLHRAGELVREGLEYALNHVKPGMSVLELCAKIEQNIASKGGFPAFPVNVSINDVAAHYTAEPHDKLVIPEKGIIKVDVGAHVDGYIADGAVSVVLGEEYAGLALASLEALKKVGELMRSGVRLGYLGKVVEKTIVARGFRPIENLSGHKIERYNLHAGKTVPNVSSLLSGKALEGEVYAVEPFATNGVGIVVEGGESHIFRVTSMKKLKNRDLQTLLRDLWLTYRGLPFASRWVYEKWGEDGVERLYSLVEMKRIHHYAMLVEAGGGAVAQFEDTFIVGKARATPLIGVVELVK